MTQPINRFSGIEAHYLSKAEKEAVIKLALDVLKKRYRPGKSFTDPVEVSNFLRLQLADRKNEIFGALFLDTRHRLILMEELFYGTVDGTTVHPRIVVQKALECNASALVVFHNHPSGVAEPSNDDSAITRRLREALALVDIRLLDHFVVGADEVVSFATRGLL
jgi:DNA repair protein RadC